MIKLTEQEYRTLIRKNELISHRCNILVGLIITILSGTLGSATLLVIKFLKEGFKPDLCLTFLISAFAGIIFCLMFKNFLERLTDRIQPSQMYTPIFENK